MQSGNSFCGNVQKMQIFSVKHKRKVAEKSINRSEHKKGMREREEWNQEIKIVKCFFFSYISLLQQTAMGLPLPHSAPLSMWVAFVYFRSHARTCVAPFLCPASVIEGVLGHFASFAYRSAYNCIANVISAIKNMRGRENSLPKPIYTCYKCDSNAT